jgi:hypothetical protein
MVKEFYKGQKQEHTVNDINTSVVVIGTEEIEGFGLSYVQAKTDISSVIKLFAENASDSKKIPVLLVGEGSYAERYELARAYNVGLYFPNNVHIESLKGYSAMEIDEYAAQAGVLKNLKRFVASVARQVPFSMTREQAVERVAIVAMHCEAIDVDQSITDAINLLNKTIDGDVTSYQYSRKISLDSLISESFLAQRKPGPAASEELEAYAARIFVEGGIHVLGDGMGKGKTTHVIRNVIKSGIATGEKPTFLTHRIAIARSSAIVDLVEQYNDKRIEGREDQLDALSLVINKCDNERYRVHTQKSKILILDEGSQVVRHLMQKGFMGDRCDVFHELLKLMKEARLVLVCEAFITNVLMNFIRLAGRPINFMQGNTDYSSINVCLGSTEATQREVLRALGQGLKISIGADSRKLAETAARIATDQGKRVLLVTQKTKDHDEVLEFFNNPNAAIKKYDVLAFSPSMQSSVSITDDYFEAHFCIFSGIVSIDDAKQFIRRDRTAKKVMVGISATTDFMIEKKEVIKGFYGSGDALFDSIAIEQLHMNAREKNHFQQWLSMSFEIDGFTISRLANEELADLEASKIFKNGRKALKQTVTEGTLVAGMSAFAVGKIDKFDAATNDNQYFHNNFIATAESTQKAFSEVTKDDVTFFNEGAGIVKLFNASCWLLDRPQFSAMSARFDANGIDDKHSNLIRELFSKVMSKLDITKDGEGIITPESLKIACDFIKLRELDFKMTKLVNVRIGPKSERQQHAIITAMLSSMGLSKERIMKNGVQVYQLSRSRFLQVLSYIDYYRYNELTASLEDRAEFVAQVVECDLDTAVNLAINNKDIDDILSDSIKE